ncbi:MAG: DMT family transporter [Spirochaetes bacterium]|nr:DMT family transporter [Spirochaetota bacterium]
MAEERTYSLKADFLLLLTALIWGFAFVAQRVGMESIGPFAYNAVRFAIGAAMLVPLRFALRGRKPGSPEASVPGQGKPGASAWRVGALAVAGSVVAGTVLFTAASLQQAGLVTTTAGNAGFITCLYVVIVPAIHALSGRKIGRLLWIGAALAMAGLYFLGVDETLRVRPGDLVVLAGAFFWAFHILVIDRLSPGMNSLDLAIGQFATCALLSLGAAWVFEPHPFAGFLPALVPILYGGVLSIGVAFTLQIVAQKKAHPARASIILAMESPFAGIGGILLLGEPLTGRILGGAALMLAGMLCAQGDGAGKVKSPGEPESA